MSDELRDLAWREIDRAGSHLVSVGRQLERMPEPGYCEYRTRDLAARLLADLGADVTGGAITGVIARGPGPRSGPVLVLLGELDAVCCPEHPLADPDTGYAHACGHQATVASAYGALLGLTRSGVLGDLGGEVRVVLSPAEEYLGLSRRKQLSAEGRLVLPGGGKQELLLEPGALADAAAAILAHPGPEGANSLVGATPGVIACWVLEDPRAGVKAQRSLSLAEEAVETLARELHDRDSTAEVNVLAGHLCGDPGVDQVVGYVRSDDPDSLHWAGEALRARIDSLPGVSATVLPGYLPRRRSPGLDRVCARALSAALGGPLAHRTEEGVTDVGDLSWVMPTAIALIGCARGTAHDPGFSVTDPWRAYVGGARFLSGVVVDLLADGAAVLGEVTRGYPTELKRSEDLVPLWRRLTESRGHGI